ncbi:hypothetical protein SKAU_G00034860 [Synaphobranchus kaupii]|uniref:F-actin monooxygenase n=1 Tax=Synaphobranchus kaupii TaxID=118154 RepID=A0A9Q1JEL7_SYNKA|nr:hypothetical protein SKAU_G00034860 [Synaphobranchus kaupii]
MGDGVGATGGGGRVNQSHVLFDRFTQASTCKGTLKAFQELCDFLDLRPTECRIFYHKLKSRLNYWKAKALWAKLDKRACHKDYKKGRACANSKCLIIGAGPCGLRTAIELAFLGAKVVLLEKRDAFSRNNVLHLWPFTIQDLRGLGAKKFYGKFCAGAIDHISIRQLQLVLLKVALLLGIEVHVNVEFKRLMEPPEDQENERIGWRAEVLPQTHPVNEFEFDVIIGADGRRNTLPGFRRKEFRGKLAIAITANFINRHTSAEAKVEEISGVAFIFNQKFFQDLRETTGVNLENIVYYKDDTHYFVMTAKKQSLLEKGVILNDYGDTERLLSRGNVDQEALLSYAREAADFSTNHQLPALDFAINHYGQPDVAMFDFTCMYASENAALVRQRNGHQLLLTLVGDSLLEPFWPMGTGIARGFLAAMDSAWMVRSWAQGRGTLDILAERESIYRLLPQTTPENISKNVSQYSLDPTTRYPNISLSLFRRNQVRHLIDTGESGDLHIDVKNAVNSSTAKLTRRDSIARSSKLLSWCQKQTEGYPHVAVTDLTMSWKSGLALCAIIHRFRPDLIDFDSLEERDVERNNQLGLDVAERELGISPIMTGKEMSSVGVPDKLSMAMYLTQFYEMFKDTPPTDNKKLSPEEKAAFNSSIKSPISFLSKLGQSLSRKRNPKDQKEKDTDGVRKRRKTSQAGQSQDEDGPHSGRDDKPPLVSALTERRVEVSGDVNHKVRSMANQLLAKFEENAPAQPSGLKRQGSLRKEFPQCIGGSDVCFFCQRRVYVMERLSAEGKFFHRSCFKCDYCSTTLRLSSYAFDVQDGKFYCKPHYCYRLSGHGQRKRPAPPVAPPSAKDKQAPMPGPALVDVPGQVVGVLPAEPRPSGTRSVVEVNWLQEPSLAKRLRSTPERIELENYRVSLGQQEVLEEVPEETLAEHNLSSVLDKPASVEEGSSSSESEEEGEGCAPSDLGGVAWKEEVERHTKLRGGVVTGEEEDDDDDEDDEEEEESSDEGEYCPVERELQSGRWLQELSDEEGTGTDSGTAAVLSQEALQGTDTLSFEVALRRPPLHPSQSTEHCEEEEDDEEVGSQCSAELHEEDVPSDSEAQSSKASELLPAFRRKGSPVHSTVSPRQSVGEDVKLPVSDVLKAGAQASSTSPCPFLLKSALAPFFPEPLVPDEVKPQRTSGNPDAKSPCTPVPPETPSQMWTQLTPTTTSTPRPELAKPTTPVDRDGVIQKFWTKSAEIRKSLAPGLLPQGRGETGPAQPQSRGSNRGGLSSGSAVRLNGAAANESYASEATLLTPPSTPPPAPPDEEPATLLPGKRQVAPETAPEATPEPEAAQPEMHRSFLESVDEIPFADEEEEEEEEDSCDKFPPCTSDQAFFTPPSGHAPRDPPVRHALENSGSGKRTQGVAGGVVGAVARGVAEERMRAWGKSIKSQALRDAMERQIRQMKEVDAPEYEPAREASNPPSEDCGKSKASLATGVTVRKTRKQAATSLERAVPAPGGGRSLGGSADTSGSSGEGKNEKHASLFSPHKNKERKAKAEPGETPPKHGSLWKAVFSGYRKKDDQSQFGSASSNETTDSAKNGSPLGRSSDLLLHRNLTVSEDSDLSCDDVLERSSPSKADPVYVPHALAFRRVYGVKRKAVRRKKRVSMPASSGESSCPTEVVGVLVAVKEPSSLSVSETLFQKTYTEEELNAKLTRRVQKVARQQAKREELKRLHRAQIIQRQLEQVEEKQRYLEEKGVAVEKALRGEAGMGKEDDPRLMQEWFTLVQEKNSLVRYESELMIFAQELELEDRQSRLQQDLRERMAVEDHLKTEQELAEEKRVLSEMLEVVEQRDALVALLEEQRLREKEEDEDLEAAMLTKGHSFNWA